MIESEFLFSLKPSSHQVESSLKIRAQLVQPLWKKIVKKQSDIRTLIGSIVIKVKFQILSVIDTEERIEMLSYNLYFMIIIKSMKYPGLPAWSNDLFTP